MAVDRMSGVFSRVLHGGMQRGIRGGAPPPPPTFTVFRRQALANGHGIALSVLGAAIERSDIERITAKERRSLVRVLVYTPDQTIGKERAAALWEHIEGRGLKQIY